MTLEELRTTKRARGFTKAQLAEWGVSWPPKKGWKRSLLQQTKSLIQTEFTKMAVCTNCQTNAAYWSAIWCEPCIWRFVKE